MEWLECQDCGEWLSLGIATDTGPFAEAVAIEIRAAEIAENGRPPGRPCPDLFGWRVGNTNTVTPLPDEWAGYLASIIYQHDKEQGE